MNEKNATERNKGSWLSISAFLCRQNLEIVLKARGAARGPACGDTSAPVLSAINFGGRGAAYTTSVPVGNTGTTFKRGEA